MAHVDPPAPGSGPGQRASIFALPNLLFLAIGSLVVVTSMNAGLKAGGAWGAAAGAAAGLALAIPAGTAGMAACLAAVVLAFRGVELAIARINAADTRAGRIRKFLCVSALAGLSAAFYLTMWRVMDEPFVRRACLALAVIGPFGTFAGFYAASPDPEGRDDPPDRPRTPNR